MYLALIMGYVHVRHHIAQLPSEVVRYYDYPHSIHG